MSRLHHPVSIPGLIGDPIAGGTPLVLTPEGYVKLGTTGPGGDLPPGINVDDLLFWDGGQWIPLPPGGAPLNTYYISVANFTHGNLGDVTTSQHHVRYADAEAIAAVGPHTPAQTFLHIDLTDVSPDQHHPQLHDLDSHTDVVALTPISGQVLTFDGADWVPRLSQSALGFVELDYRFNTSNDTTPLPGRIQYNDDDPALATVMYVNEEDRGGDDRSLFWDELKPGDWLNLHDPDDVDGRHQRFDVTGLVTQVADVFYIPITLFDQAGADFGNGYQITVFIRYIASPPFSGNHDDLSNVLPDQHHIRYTDAEAIAAVDNGTYLKLAGGTMVGHIDMQSNRIVGLTWQLWDLWKIRGSAVAGLVFTDAANVTVFRFGVGFIDFKKTDGSTISLEYSYGGDFWRFGSELRMGDTNKIVDLADPTLDQDAATKKYVDDSVGVGGPFLPLAGGLMSGDIDMGGQSFDNVAFITSQPGGVVILGGSGPTSQVWITIDGGAVATFGGTDINVNVDVEMNFNNILDVSTIVADSIKGPLDDVLKIDGQGPLGSVEILQNGLSFIVLDDTKIRLGRQVWFNSGTEALPGIAFTDNTNLGVFRKASGVMGFTTAGVERAYLNFSEFQLAAGTHYKAEPLTTTQATSEAIWVNVGGDVWRLQRKV